MMSLQAMLLLAAISGGGETVLLNFSADWCGYCQKMEPTARRLASDGCPVRKIDVDKYPRLAAQYKVTAIPCFVMLVEGREVARITGPASYDRLRQMVGQASERAQASPRAVVRAQSPDTPPIGSETALKSASRMPAPPSSRQAALQATVRLKVEERGGYSYATGTIIDTHGEEALVLTCGHLFRESKGKGKVMVDLFAAGAKGPVPGTVIAYDADDADIGFVSIRPGIPVKPVMVAAAGHRSQIGERVFSIGCDHGQPPSIRNSKVTHIDRYQGAPNIEVAGQPVLGRSGGGLFTEQGLLIGVCNAADEQDDEGIYAALRTIQRQLDKIGQQRVYQRSSNHRLAEAIPPHNARLDLPPRQASPPPLPMNMPRVVQPVRYDEAPLSPTQNQRMQQQRLRDLLSQLQRGAEVICIVRPRDGQGRNEVIVLDRSSLEPLHQAIREFPPAAGPAVLHADRSPANGPVIRAQSGDRY